MGITTDRETADIFKTIYKILSTLEAALDLPAFNMELISPERLGISKERWLRYMEMLIDEGYIKGIAVMRDITGERYSKGNDPRITLKGLEYLQENTIMQRIYMAAKGIADLIP